MDEERARPQVPELWVYENDSISRQEGRTPTCSGESWREVIQGHAHLPAEQTSSFATTHRPHDERFGLFS